MQVLSGLNGLTSLPAGTALSIGNFDGLHRGHRLILQTCRRLVGADGKVAVVTFEPHPLTVLRPELAPPRLTPPSLKEMTLERAGVDYLVVLPPEPEVLNLTAEAFWAMLRDQVRPAYLVEGEEFNFGKGRGGTIHKLREWAKGTAVKLEVVKAVEVALTDLSVVRISSTLVRYLLAFGRVRDAAICLGRAYVLEGKVVEGYRRGRQIGMPTANLDCGDQLVPADGVYVGRCEIEARMYPAAVSIGRMPTFGDNKRQIEAHLIGFDGDLYGRTIQLDMIDWIRDQMKFPSIDQLKARMARDLQWTAERANFDPSSPIAAL